MCVTLLLSSLRPSLPPSPASSDAALPVHLPVLEECAPQPVLDGLDEDARDDGDGEVDYLHHAYARG